MQKPHMISQPMSPEILGSSALCAASILSWIYFAVFWKRKSASDYGQIKLDSSSDEDNSDNDSISYLGQELDKDTLVDVDKWKGKILLYKACCMVVSVLATAAWIIVNHQAPRLSDLLQVMIWSNFTAVCAIWKRQTTVHNHWRTTVVISVLAALAFYERCSIAVLADTSELPDGACKLYTYLAPFLLMAITLNVPRAPPLSVQSPYTYSSDTGLDKASYEQTASIWSNILFNWVTPTIRDVNAQAKLDRGKDGDGDQNQNEYEAPYLPREDRSFKLYNDWKSSCASSLASIECSPSAVERAFGTTPKYWSPLAWRVFRCHQSNILLSAVGEVVLVLMRYSPAWALDHFIRELESSKSGTAHAPSPKVAYAWLAVLILALIARTILTAATYWQWNTRISLRIKAQLCTLIFEKALQPTASGTSTDGEEPKANVLNLFSTDALRVAELPNRLFGDQLIKLPLELLTGVFLLWRNLRFAGLFGLLIPSLLMIPSQMLVKRVKSTQAELMQATDVRVQLTNEVLTNIKHVKSMAYEDAYAKKIMRAREQELEAMRRNQICKALMMTISVIGPAFTLFAALAWYTKIQRQVLTPSVAFSSVLVAEMLRRSIRSFYTSLRDTSQSLNSLNRLERFLGGPTKEGKTGHNSMSDNFHSPSRYTNLPVSTIRLKDARFGWRSETSSTQSHGEAFTIQAISAEFGPGLNLICGPTGSGKTLLLLGLLREAYLLDGTLECPVSLPTALADESLELDLDESSWLVSSCAFVPQAPWLINGTISENVLFGLPFKKERYDSVMHACALLPDLDLLPDGDQTQIGERGIILSGGQKQRVALARAMYSRASCIFLDDVLSAVDVHTAQHIYEHCLLGSISKNRCIVLVSHHVQLVAPEASLVIHLDMGMPAFVGASQEYLDTELFRKLSTRCSDNNEFSTENDDTAVVSSKTDERTKHHHVSRQAGETPRNRPGRALNKAEGKTSGSVGWSVWFYWISSSGGLAFWAVTLSVMVVEQAIWQVRDFSIGKWTDAISHIIRKAAAVFLTNNEDPHQYSGKVHTDDLAMEIAHVDNVYLLRLFILCSTVLPTTAFVHILVYAGSRRFSRTIYSRMLTSVLRAPMRFFDTALLGSLLNRFGYDTELADTELSEISTRLITLMCGIVVIMGSLAIATPLFFGPLSLLALSYIYFGRQYLNACLTLRRGDAIARSPLYSLYAEAMSGASVIRAFGAQTRFMMMNFRRNDKAINYGTHLWTFNRWLAIRYEFSSILLIGCVGAVALLVDRNTLSAGITGFLLAATIRAYQDAMFLIRDWTKAELALISVGRIREYCEIESEASAVTQTELPADWPSAGQVIVNNLTIRYAPDLPKVLDGISFVVNPGEKVAIVGSTGSGKSTLSLALLRLMEASEGSVLIDGIDISSVGLYDLRSRISFVPQDPTILSGTLREALDPLDKGIPDKAMFDALRAVHLLPSVNDSIESDHLSCFGNLDLRVGQQGKTFSAGECQLLCLARAILSKRKLHIMDEASSSVDYATDKLITETLAEEFKDATVLTIAHRLRTVIGYDKVLVLSEGRLVECGKPSDLLLDPQSHFYALCQAAGAGEFQALQDLCKGGQGV